MKKPKWEQKKIVTTMRFSRWWVLWNVVIRGKKRLMFSCWVYGKGDIGANSFVDNPSVASHL